MPWINTEINVDLSDFDEDDLIEEIKNRGYLVSQVPESVDQDVFETMALNLYYKRARGEDYQAELDQLIYYLTGRVS